MTELQPKNPESFKIALTQTAKGFVYIDKVTAEGSDLDELAKNLQKVMDIALHRCDTTNIALKGGA